jgi:predicted RNA-binding Zn ribbon-like protein
MGVNSSSPATAFLDFINTQVSADGGQQRSLLFTYDTILQWSREAKLISKSEFKTISAYRDLHTGRVNETFHRYLHVRETLYEVLSDVADKRRPDKRKQEQLNLVVSQVFPKLNFDFSEPSAMLNFNADSSRLDLPLNRIVKLGCELLQYGDSRRIRKCDRCKKIFFDTSKNRSRKWCSMQTCGNQDKALRYYYKSKGSKRNPESAG